MKLRLPNKLIAAIMAAAVVNLAAAEMQNATWTFENNSYTPDATIQGATYTYNGTGSFVASGVNTGTTIGNCKTTADLGDALTFSDGTYLTINSNYWNTGDGKLQVAAANTAANSYTIMAWVKFDSITGEVLFFGTGSGNGEGISVGVNDGGKADLLTKWVAHNYFGDSIANKMMVGEDWVNLAFTYDKTTNTTSAYLNGELLQSRTGLANSKVTTGGNVNTAYIGAGSTNTAQDNFTGQIAEFKILNAALTQEQILEEAHLEMAQQGSYAWSATGESAAWDGSSWTDTETQTGSQKFVGISDATFAADSSLAHQISVDTDAGAKTMTLEANAEYTFNLGESGAISAQTLSLNEGSSITINGISTTNLAKIYGLTGSGDLTTGVKTYITGDNSAYTGDITVENGGGIKLFHKDALGKNNASRDALTTRTITIKEGGYVDMNGFDNTSYAYTLAGGSLINNGPNTDTNHIQNAKLILTANSSIGGTGNLYIINNGWGATSVEFNGHTLTKTGSNTVGFYSTTMNSTVDNGAVNNGTLRIEGGAVSIWGTLTSHVNIEIAEGAAEQAVTGGTLSMAAGHTISSEVAGATVSSTVKLAGATTLHADGDATLTFSNAMSSADNSTGSVTKTGSGEVILNNTVSLGSATLAGGKTTFNNTASFTQISTQQNTTSTLAGTGTITISGPDNGTALAVTNGATLNIEAANLTIRNSDYTGRGTTNRSRSLAITGEGSTVNINSGVTTVYGATYTGGGAKNVTLNVGTGATAATLVTTRLEMGDSQGGSTSKDADNHHFLNIGSMGKVVVTSDHNAVGTAEDTAIVMSEWNTSIVANIAGKLYGKDAILTSNDYPLFLTVQNGGILAVNGMDSNRAKDNAAFNLTLENGGKLILGADGLKGTRTQTPWNITLNGGEIGMTADMEIKRAMTLSGATTFNTAKYTWSGSAAEQEVVAGAEGGTMTVSGALSGSGALNKVGDGTLELTGSLADYTGSLNVTGGTLSLQNTTDQTVNAGLNVDNSGALEFGGGVLYRFNSLKTVSGGAAGAHTSVSIADGTTLQLTDSGNSFAATADGEDISINGSGKFIIDSKGLTVESIDGENTAHFYVPEDRNNGGGKLYTYQLNTGNDIFFITDAKLSINSASAQTLKNTLSNTDVVNAGTGKLTVDWAANTVHGLHAQTGEIVMLQAAASAPTLQSIRAEGGNVTIQGLGDAVTANLNELYLANNRTVSVYQDATTNANAKADIAVSGALTAGNGATLNANLTMKDGSTIDVDYAHGGLTMGGSSVTFENGGKINLSNDIINGLNSLTIGEGLTLFSGVGVDAFNINGDAYNANLTYKASDFFNLSNRDVAVTRPWDFVVKFGDDALSQGGSGHSIFLYMETPEPATATLSLLALAALAARRKRK